MPVQQVIVRDRLTQLEKSLRGNREGARNPKFIERLGPKATSRYLYIQTVTTTHDDGNNQYSNDLIEHHRSLWNNQR